MSDDPSAEKHLFEQHQFELIDAARRQAAKVRSSEIAPDRGFTPFPPLDDGAPPGDLPSDQFPGYAVVREIHRGGQGVVYQATHHATRRNVAIKVLREGPFSGPKERARFEREVRILGALNHPHIVTIHDIGSAAGRFYYVMDYIDGHPLDTYVAGLRAQADPRSIIRNVLTLFARICAALHTAHLLGIVHRDLKPRNVLIDASGSPRILDFGLAKVSVDESPDAEPSMMTVTGQFVGSLPWSSPEQAEGRLSDIDTRSDVYSLGVILYQLLTGRFPYPVLGDVRDVIDHIVHRQPQRPSAKAPQLNDEIDTIVLKCLSKERDRRYPTAGALGRDIEHLLAGEPIEAKRDSRWYVLKKTLHRHRVPVVVASSFVLLILVSTVALWGMYLRAERNAEVASRQRREAVAARQAEEAARVQAELEAQKASEVERFLREMLAAADPSEARGSDLTVRQVLDTAAERIDQEPLAEPEVEASLRGTLALTYQRLGAFETAEPHAKKAMEICIRELGEDDPRTLTAINRYGFLLYDLGRFSEAEPLLRLALAGRRRVLGEVHLETMTSMNDLAVLLGTQGRLDEAEPLARRVLAVREETLGAAHNGTLIAANTLATLLEAQKKLAEAEPLFRRVVDDRRDTLPPNHPDLLGSINNLANVLRAQDKLAEAEPLLLETVELSRRVLGEEHMNTLIATSNLALVYQGQDRLDEAVAWFRTAYDGAAATLPEGHIATQYFQANLGRCLAIRGDFEDAEQHLLEAYEGIKRVMGPSHARTKLIHERVIQLYEAWDKPAEAAAWRAIKDAPPDPEP